MKFFSKKMRKILEKHQWDDVLGMKLLKEYHRVRKLKKEEVEYLAIRLSYPEKFWKVVNFYYGSRKVWIPAKNMEKLEKILKQEEEKSWFLKHNLKEEVLRKC